MSNISKLIDAIDNLSIEEMEEIKKIMEKKWATLRQQQILKEVEEARKESKEGKTLVLSSPEEIKSYFDKMVFNED